MRHIPRADADARCTIEATAASAPCRRAAPLRRRHVTPTIIAQFDVEVGLEQCRRLGVVFLQAHEAAECVAWRRRLGAKARSAAAGAAATDQLWLRLVADMAPANEIAELGKRRRRERCGSCSTSAPSDQEPVLHQGFIQGLELRLWKQPAFGAKGVEDPG